MKRITTPSVTLVAWLSDYLGCNYLKPNRKIYMLFEKVSVTGKQLHMFQIVAVHFYKLKNGWNLSVTNNSLQTH